MFKIKLVKENLPGFRGKANLYEVNPKVAENYGIGEIESDFVVASNNGSETMVFVADNNGKILSFLEVRVGEPTETIYDLLVKNYDI